MKTPVIILFILFSVNLYSQNLKPEFDGHTWKAPYSLPIPKDWTIERFLIPISFAPQIPYKGIEDIRFTPGWGKAKSDEYWSYAFLWYLDGEIKMNAAILNNNLRAYYTGLIRINRSNTTIGKMSPVITTFKETEKEVGDLQTYIGTVKMEDYMTQNPLILNGKVHVKSCPEDNKTLIFYELSPQALSHPVWQSLDKLWIDFKCKK